MDCDEIETEATKTIGSTDIEKVLKKLKNKHTKESIIILDYISKQQTELDLKDKVIDLLIDDVYDNDNFWRLKCGFEKIEKGKEKEYIKEKFYKKVGREDE